MSVSIPSKSAAEATASGPAVDPLLIAARVLLWVFIAGAVLAVAMSVIGLITYTAAQGSALRVPVWEPVWRPVAELLSGLAALSIATDIALGLLAMIGAVARGEAFATGNVGRMERIAWNVIGLQLLGFLAATAGAGISGEINGVEIGLDLSPAGIAFALLLFILARVFRQGAAMREDLAGTV